MNILTIVVRVFCGLIILAFGGVVAETAYSKVKKSKAPTTAPKQDQNWEDIKQTFPETASDLDTPAIIAERRAALLADQERYSSIVLDEV